MDNKDQSTLAVDSQQNARPRPLSIKIITENLDDPPASSKPSIPSSQSELQRGEFGSSWLDSRTGPAHPTIRSNDINSVPNNFLVVPSLLRHSRSHSTSSTRSFILGWMESPCPTTPASDIGDPQIDTVKILATSDANVNSAESPFAFTVEQLAKLHDPKDLNVLRAMHGLRGLCMGLQTDVSRGLSRDEDILDERVTIENIRQILEPNTTIGSVGLDNKNMESTSTGVLNPRPTRLSLNFYGDPQSFRDRTRVFGKNRIPVRKAKNIFELMWMVLQDKVLILLCAAAAISLALGLYQTFRLGSTDKLEWIEGVAILVAVAIATVAQSVNDYQKERQFRKLNLKKEDRNIKVVRGGRTGLTSIYDIVVGDVLLLEPGDIVPADAILVEGHNVRCDESSITGESNTLKKVPANIALENTSLCSAFNEKYDPFILSGSKVLEGVGACIVTGVGINSCHGRTMMTFREEAEDTPLQIRLNRIADMIAKWGSGIALLLFLILFVKYLARLPGSNQSASQKGEHFMQILIVAVSIIVVAVPEGLPLAVTLSLAYATVRMLEDNNLVRVLKACETMGNATTICCDKTGTLTENKMLVVVGTLGVSDVFVRKLYSADNRGAGKESQQTQIGGDDAVPMQQFFGGMSDQIKTLLRQSVAVNSTAFEDTDESGNKIFIGSKTESALLTMAKDYLGVDDVSTERSNANVVQRIPFSSERKWMGTVVKVKINGNTMHRLFVKGATEIVLQYSNRVIEGEKIEPKYLSNEDRRKIEQMSAEYASQSLRLIALAYRDFAKWPPNNVRVVNDTTTQVEYEDLFKDMVLVSVIGIMDPLRPGVTQAVDDCHKAGVFVRMITGDNILTAKAIAKECGILTTGGIVMEGPHFRDLSEAEMDLVIPRLQVLARSSPLDKRRLVERLKYLGEIVAVTGDGTNDGPALKTAHVGFSMGITGTEVAKEASSIILMDDNFASIVKAITWGRCVNDAVKKFLQLTVSVTAVGLTLVTSIASDVEAPSVTPVQLLWVNLIQDTLGALALATDPPTLTLLDRLPQPIGASLISFNMWKMIFGQSLLQLAVTIVLSFSGSKIFTSWPTDIVNTVVFNTFVWLQIFNEINCRRIDDKLNVFSGIQRNPFFIIIMTIIIAGQILIIFVGGAAFSVTRLSGLQWLVSILLGALSIPWGALVRLIPNEFLLGLIPRLPFTRRQKQEAVFGGAEPTPSECDETIVKVRADRRFYGGKFGCLGNRDRQVQRPTPAPSDFPSSLARASFDDKSPTVESRNDACTDTPELPFYSVFNASQIAPALVVTSTTSPQRSTFESRRGLEPEELSTIEGIEVYGQSNPQHSVISVEITTTTNISGGRESGFVRGGKEREQDYKVAS